jgi:hypothetical protein
VSAPEQTEVDVGQKGSVKVVRNAKGDAQFEVKVYVDDTLDEIQAAKETALSVYRELQHELGYPVGYPGPRA